MEKHYRIAGLTVKMESFGRTVEQASPYACDTDEKYDIEVISIWPTIKSKYPMYTDDMGEYLSTGAVFYKHLLNFDGLMLHSSAVVVDGNAYLFTADSGTGKSTHTRLWLDMFKERAFILNDDKPALRRENGIWYAYGTPWSGKNDISVNARIPVGGIAAIERAETNEITPFYGIRAINAIMKQVNRPKAAEYRAKLMELMDKLITEVPIWKLQCNMDPEAAVLSYEAMSGEKWRE